MAYIPMNVGGGKYREYILWQNPSPSSTFAAQTVTLSDDIDNYDFLKIYYTNHNSESGTNDPYSVLISVVDFKSSLPLNATRHNVVTLGSVAPSNNRYARHVLYDTDTTVNFGTTTQIGANSTTSVNVIPVQISGIKMGTVKQFNNVKDYIRDKVFNGGFTEITTLTPYSDRVTTNEGKIVADTLNHVVYVYVDFTTNSAFGTSSDWARTHTLTSGIANYLPIYNASTRQSNLPLFTDESSANNTKQFFYGYGMSGATYVMGLAYGQTVNSGERYILYTMYTYR